MTEVRPIMESDRIAMRMAGIPIIPINDTNNIENIIPQIEKAILDLYTYGDVIIEQKHQNISMSCKTKDDNFLESFGFKWFPS